MTLQNVFRPRETCWRVERSDRVTFLVDGEAYFCAFKRAALKARRSIIIVGWNFDRRIFLEFTDKAMPDIPNRLGPFLTFLTNRRADLHINILNWDSPLPYKLEREWLPRLRLKRMIHPRVSYVLDNQHPLGGAQHQKIVIIDDVLAFVGGIDLCTGRLDSRAHIPNDPRRRDPSGTMCPPRHDIQVALSGDVARALGEIARERWESATGQRLSTVNEAIDPWPDDLDADLVGVDVAIARTRPTWKSVREVREVEALYLASIWAAREFIYIENQYLTAFSIADALRKRLEEEQGPEIVLILPCEPSGWIEQTAMGIAQRRNLATLRKADHYSRLRIYTPMAGEQGEEAILVHAKAMIVDGCFVRIGSANLNNRSMGLDSECDIAFAGAPGSKEQAAITKLRDDLLAEHLACRPCEVSRVIAEKGSLIEAVEALRRAGRGLIPLPETPPNGVDALIAETGILDPAATIEPEQLADEFVEDRVSRRRLRNALLRLLAMLALLAGLAAFWRLGPGAEYNDALNLAELARHTPHWWSGVAMMLAAYLVGGLLMFPVIVLILATGLIFGPGTGLLVALIGSLSSAALGYAVGAVLGKETLRWLTRNRLDEIGRALARRGVLSVTIIRVLPIAPFTLINFTAGASHIRLRDFLVGTAMGMSPGIVAITIFSGQLRAVLESPDWRNLAILFAVLAAIVAVSIWSWRRFAYHLTARDD